MITDLEIYDIFRIAYSDMFGDREEDDFLFDEVIDYAHEVLESGSIDVMLDLIERLIYMTHPVQAWTGEIYHSIGKIELKDKQILMEAAIKRLAR